MCSSTAYDEQAQLKKAYINLNSTLIAHIEQWGNISYLYIIDFFRDGKYIHQGSINELSNYETMFQGFPKTYIPSINFYIVGTIM